MVKHMANNTNISKEIHTLDKIRKFADNAASQFNKYGPSDIHLISLSGIHSKEKTENNEWKNSRSRTNNTSNHYEKNEIMKRAQLITRPYPNRRPFRFLLVAHQALERNPLVWRHVISRDCCHREYLFGFWISPVVYRIGRWVLSTIGGGGPRASKIFLSI